MRRPDNPGAERAAIPLGLFNPERSLIMKAFRELRRFILIMSAEGRQAEIRSYVTEHVQRFALAFNVPPQTLLRAMKSVPDDGVLATRFLETMMKAEDLLRAKRKERRARTAQASADALATCVQWNGKRALIDMPSLLSSALTRRNDLLVFTCDQFTVGVFMAPLLDLARIARARADLAGYVDSRGVHLRWRTGGLNLFPQIDPKAHKIIVHLPPMPAVVAA